MSRAAGLPDPLPDVFGVAVRWEADGRTQDLLLSGTGLGRLTRALARREAALYRQIAPPDVLVVLSIDPEIAVARRADEEAGYVRERNTEVRTADWAGTGAVVVDASLPRERVLAAVQQAVWSGI